MQKVEVLSQAYPAYGVTTISILFAFFMMSILLPNVIGPLWGLLTGKKSIPLIWREVARRGHALVDDDDVRAGVCRGRHLRIRLLRIVKARRRRVMLFSMLPALRLRA